LDSYVSMTDRVAIFRDIVSINSARFRTPNCKEFQIFRLEISIQSWNMLASDVKPTQKKIFWLIQKKTFHPSFQIFLCDFIVEGRQHSMRISRFTFRHMENWILEKQIWQNRLRNERYRVENSNEGPPMPVSWEAQSEKVPPPIRSNSIQNRRAR
jgi:hypothetical protein